jgi:hypothetical protein
LSSTKQVRKSSRCVQTGCDELMRYLNHKNVNSINKWSHFERLNDGKESASALDSDESVLWQ